MTKTEQQSTARAGSLERMVSLLMKAFGSEVREVTVKMRDCQDVPNFLKKLDAIQKRTAKSKLHFGTRKQKTKDSKHDQD